MNIDEIMNNRLVRNAIRTPDGTVIESRSRHNYVTYEDANGLTYMVDGGLDYLRRSFDFADPAEELAVYMSDGHEAVREALTWGTYGKDGKSPLTYVRLCDMETDHIQACLDTVNNMYPQIRESMETELRYRKQCPYT
jgi:hypothetical protein